jgi:hypothetical protein
MADDASDFFSLADSQTKRVEATKGDWTFEASLLFSKVLG